MTEEFQPPYLAVGLASATIQFCGEPRTVYIHNTHLAHIVAQAVLSGKSYPLWPHLPEVRTVLDVGANVGLSALYFASSYPQARVLSFEPFRPSYEMLLRNVEGVANISSFNCGLFDQDKQAALHLGMDDSVTNSVGFSCESSAEQTVEITLRDAKAVLQEQGITAIDILKLDTEGCELPILRAIADWFPRLGVLYLEFHHEADRLEIDRLLSATHSLVAATITVPHRGELCYVLREIIPDEYNDRAISFA